MEDCQINRLGIFIFYDKDGIVDDYIPYLLKDMQENLSRLVVIVNGKITAEGRGKLERFTSEVVCRENAGFDFMAWKYALENYLGWDAAAAFDELVLFNDTFFGPFYPFKQVFDKMAAKPADFWGLTAHGKTDEFPEHIQSYFLVFRSRLLHAAEFRRFWVARKPAKDFYDAVHSNEVILTKYFADAGFTWDVAFDMSDIDEQNGAVNHYLLNTYEILKRGYPILKKKVFTVADNNLNVNNNESLRRGIDFIKNNTQYDTTLIYRHILRVFNIADIHDSLHLNYILPDNTLAGNKETQPKMLVVLHITYTEALDYYAAFIEKIPPFIDILVTTISRAKKTLIEQAFSPAAGTRLTVIVKENRGRDISALLIAAKPFIKNYEYLCFCHDKRSKQECYVTGRSFEDLLWYNMFGSEQYIENIVHTFESEQDLGLLVPPIMRVAAYRGHIATNHWTNNFESTVRLAKKLGIKADISREKPVLTIGTAFWCRVSALKKLFDHKWKYEDFPEEPLPVDGAVNHAIERIFSFAAQDAGYYTGTVMTPEYGAITINNEEYFLYHDPVIHSAFFGQMRMFCFALTNMPHVHPAGFCLDYGRGFSHQERRYAEMYVRANRKFTLTIPVEVIADTALQNIRIDFGEGLFCGVEDLRITCGNEEIPVAEHNALAIENGLVFKTVDPWVVVNTGALRAVQGTGAYPLVVRGIITFFDFAEVYSGIVYPAALEIAQLKAALEQRQNLGIKREAKLLFQAVERRLFHKPE